MSVHRVLSPSCPQRQWWSARMEANLDQLSAVWHRAGSDSAASRFSFTARTGRTSDDWLNMSAMRSFTCPKMTLKRQRTLQSSSESSTSTRQQRRQHPHQWKHKQHQRMRRNQQRHQLLQSRAQQKVRQWQSPIINPSIVTGSQRCLNRLHIGQPSWSRDGKPLDSVME